MNRKTINQDSVLYRDQLKAHIFDILLNASLPFEEIVKHANGAFPSDVLIALDSLVAAGEISEANGKYHRASMDGLISVSNISYSKKSTIPEFLLSEPHPADYDWRFTSETLRNLRDDIIAMTTNDDSILLLGATTLYPVIYPLNRNTVLINKSISLINDLKAAGYDYGLINHDLFYPLTQKLVSPKLIFADPPWYTSFYKAFVLRATEVIEHGGYLLLSLLPDLTRPNAISDRQEIIDFSFECGFELIEIKPQHLKYQVPNFERAAMGVLGLVCNEWRTGDLAIFKKIKENECIDQVQPPHDEPQWVEYIINNKKVKVRVKEDLKTKLFNCAPVDYTPILSTVSRRARIRTSIDFWTSDNIAYSVDRTDILNQALEILILEGGIEAAMVKLSHIFPLSVDELNKIRILLGYLI